MSYPGPVVSAQWLADNLRAPKLRVVDATVHLPDTGRDARAEYLAEHIRGASFFDLSKIADPNNPLPRKFPPVEVFAREVGALGIDNDTHVVAYDTPGLYSAARVWWLFRQYGYDRVSILDGGLKTWKAEGRPVEAGDVQSVPAVFKAGRWQRITALTLCFSRPPFRSKYFDYFLNQLLHVIERKQLQLVDRSIDGFDIGSPLVRKLGVLMDCVGHELLTFA